MPGNVIELIIKAIDRASGTLRQIADNARQSTQGMASIGESFRKDIAEAVEEANRSIAESFQAVGQRAMIAGGAIAGGLGYAVKTAADFEAQMSKVKALAGASEEDFRRLRDAAIELGAQSVYSASEAAEGMQILAAAGFSANQIIEAMPGLLNAAAAAGENFGTVADIMVAAMSGFGLQAQDMAHIADVLASAANASAISITDIGYSLKYVAPVASVAGVSLEEVAAALAILGNAGIKADQAGTTLRMALIRLADPPKEAAAMLQQLGVQITDASGKMLPFQEIIAQLHQRFSGLTEAQKLQAAATIFGAESMSGMLALIEAGPEKLGALTAEFQNSAGAAQEMANTMTDNLPGAIEEMKGSLESALIAIGSELAPTIRSAAETVKGLIDRFNQLPEPVQRAVATFAAASSGALLLGGSLLMVIGRIPEMVAGAQQVKTVLSAMGPAFTGAGKIAQTAFGIMSTAAKGFFALMLANPIVAIIAGIVTAVTLLALAWKNNWGDIQGKTRAAVDAIKRFIGSIVDFVKRLPSEMLSWGRKMIENLAQGIRNAIGSVLSGAVDAVRSVLSRLNPFARHSPSLVEQVWAGVKEIGRAYESLKGLSLPAPQLAGAGAPASAASGPLVIQGPLIQVGSLQVRSEEDVRRVSQELYGLIRQSLRGRGVK